MSNIYDQLALAVEDFELKVVDKAVGQIVITMTTPLEGSLAIARNKVITALRSTFFTQTGHINFPALLSFCHSYDFRYSTVPFGNVSSFSIMCGNLTLMVNA